jgi:hypothetical protein
MSDLRQLIAWLLVGLVAVVGAGAAVLGVAQAPKNVPLHEAIDNTLAAPNYTEVLTEVAAQGKQTEYLVFQSPDRLGGYVQSGNKRTYVYVIGNVEYQSLTVDANAPTSHLTFYKQASAGAKALDRAHIYLPYASQAKHVTQSGSTYTFTLTKAGQTGTFVYTVNGQYVSEFLLTVQAASVHLVISQVGTSPPVELPAGAKIVSAPATGSPAG